LVLSSVKICRKDNLLTQHYELNKKVSNKKAEEIIKKKVKNCWLLDEKIIPKVNKSQRENTPWHCYNFSCRLPRDLID
jgi:hypothetical protein